MWKCPRCNNIDQKYVCYLNNIPYCRKCISFKKRVAPISNKIKPQEITYNLNYELSEEQERIASNLIINYQKNQNTLVHAVCGAGKTEIVLKVIKQAISEGKRVGFIIPRKQVVIEIQRRLASIFSTLRVSGVYGGHNSILDGDIVVLTAHQSYLYTNKFGLVIVDEVDAFPYYGNSLLKTFVEKSCYGCFIYLSATPPNEYFKNQVQVLNKRYHQHPLPLPILIRKNNLRQIFWLYKMLKIYQKERKPCFVYLPTIKLCKQFYYLFKMFINDCYLFHSQIEQKNEIESKFRKHEYNVLFATTILERGITFINLQVIVLFSDHLLFNSKNLVQIAGRVGRNKNYPKGEVYFLAQKITYEMKEALNEIKKANLLV